MQRGAPTLVPVKRVVTTVQPETAAPDAVGKAPDKGPEIHPVTGIGIKAVEPQNDPLRACGGRHVRSRMIAPKVRMRASAPSGAVRRTS
jgi:hypothetical protein